MNNDREEWITRRAYELWDEAGRPDGQDHEHWRQASAEWEEEQGKASQLDPVGRRDLKQGSDIVEAISHSGSHCGGTPPLKQPQAG